MKEVTVIRWEVAGFPRGSQQAKETRMATLGLRKGFSWLGVSS